MTAAPEIPADVMAAPREVVCLSCGGNKSAGEFYFEKRFNSIRQPCKECFRAKERSRRSSPKVRAKEREYKVANRNKTSEYSRNFRSRNPGYSSNRARVWCDNNPEKRAAHQLTWSAIRSGKLIRQPCEVCGGARAQAHHDDYSKPLSVRWLCQVHHSEYHAAIQGPTT